MPTNYLNIYGRRNGTKTSGAIIYHYYSKLHQIIKRKRVCQRYLTDYQYVVYSYARQMNSLIDFIQQKKNKLNITERGEREEK